METLEVDGVSYTIPHALGEPCGVVALAKKHYGEQAGDVLLEFTCFPFNDERALVQLRDFIEEGSR